MAQVDYEAKYLNAVSILRRLLRSAWHERKGYCSLCGSANHVGHMECPAEIAQSDLDDLLKEVKEEKAK